MSKQDKPVARLLHWIGPAPRPGADCIARTFAEYPVGTDENKAYWLEGAHLYTRPAPPVAEPALPELVPVAEVTQVDLHADHQGPVEAFAFLPVGTKLYAAPSPARVPVLTDEQIDDAIKACPLEGYGLLCEMPADMTGANFKKTVRQWARAVLAAAARGSKP